VRPRGQKNYWRINLFFKPLDIKQRKNARLVKIKIISLTSSLKADRINLKLYLLL
jgi:hypothetical protein